MRSSRWALVGVVLIAGIASPAATALAAAAGESLTTVADPVVHVTPDGIAEIPFYLKACPDALTCEAPIAIYALNGHRLSDAAPAAFLPSLANDSFPGLRLTRDAVRDVRRSHRLFARLELRLPAGRTELVGYETLIPPSPGQRRWCSGVRRLAPPCTGPFR